LTPRVAYDKIRVFGPFFMLGSNFFKFSVKDHNKIKSNLMDLIAKTQDSDGGFDRDKETESRTDYWYRGEIFYRSVFLEATTEIYNNLLKITGTDAATSEFWYQQYIGKQFHQWHTHANSNLSSIYFVDLPDIRDCTDFYDLKNRKILKPKVEEGDLIVFPSYVPHRSGPLHGEKKTIISTNYNFYINGNMDFLKELKYDHLGNPI